MLAHPHLCEVNKSDKDYKESWGDPRIKKEEKPQNTQRQTPKKQEKKRGRKM